MSSQRIAIVWNPSKDTSQEELAEALPDADLEVSWFETAEDDPGRGATEQALATGAGLVLAVGGDGTVRAVAEHLAQTGADVDLGIIPLGTGNLLARNLEIPIDDLKGAFRRALEGEAQPVDVGWAELTVEGEAKRHAFAVMAGFGVDAHMISETKDELKDKAGWLAYVESLGRAISASEVIDVTLTAGGKVSRDEAHTVLVGNCGTLTGSVTLLPDANPSDGELDLLVLNADGLGGWLETLRNLAWDNGVKRLFGRGEEAESNSSSTHSRVTDLRIELSEPRLFEVDGDEVGETTEISISIQPGAIRVR
ncbi:diacylglycerol/lipid kinase family protein [Tessaracoccus terricola]